MSNKNVLLTIEDKKVGLFLQSGDQFDTFKIKIGGKGSFDYLARGTGFKNENLNEIDDIYRSFSELSGEDEFARLGITFVHENQEKGFVGAVRESKINDKGQLVFEGKIKNKVKSADEEFDLSDIVGKKLRNLNNDFEFVLDKKFQIKDSEIKVDTFTLNEAKKVFGDIDLDSDDLEKTDVAARFRIIDNKFPSTSNLSYKRLGVELISFKESIEGVNDSSLDIHAKLEPFLIFEAHRPESFWDAADWEEYWLELGVGVEWDAGISLATDGGNANLSADLANFEGPSYSIPTPIPFSEVKLDSGLNLKGDVLIRGTEANYDLNASQEISYSMRMDGGGNFWTTAINPGVNITTPNIDEIELVNFTATAEPYLSVGASIGLPDWIDTALEFFDVTDGEVNLASITGTLSLPIGFELDVNNRLTTPRLKSYVTVAGHYNANINLLSELGINGVGIDKDLADGDFFNWKSDNLLA